MFSIYLRSFRDSRRPCFVSHKQNSLTSWFSEIFEIYLKIIKLINFSSVAKRNPTPTSHTRQQVIKDNRILTTKLDDCRLNLLHMCPKIYFYFVKEIFSNLCHVCVAYSSTFSKKSFKIKNNFVPMISKLCYLWERKFKR